MSGGQVPPALSKMDTPRKITVKFDESIPKWKTFFGVRPVVHTLDIEYTSDPITIHCQLNGEAAYEITSVKNGLRFETPTKSVILKVTEVELNNILFPINKTTPVVSLNGINGQLPEVSTIKYIWN